MYYISHLVVGQFLIGGNQKIERKKVTVGRPFSIHCPKHRESYNVRYKWEYQQALKYVTLPPSRRYFVSENGTLYFSFMESKDVSLSGIRCTQQGSVNGKKRTFISHKILFLEDTTKLTGTVWSVDALNKKYGSMQRIAHANNFACVVVQIWYNKIARLTLGLRYTL